MWLLFGTHQPRTPFHVTDTLIFSTYPAGKWYDEDDTDNRRTSEIYLLPLQLNTSVYHEKLHPDPWKGICLLIPCSVVTHRIFCPGVVFKEYIKFSITKRHYLKDRVSRIVVSVKHSTVATTPQNGKGTDVTRTAVTRKDIS